MAFAVLVEVDNSGEDPEEGRRRLHDELGPAVKRLPGFQSLPFLTAFDRGLGFGVMVFDERTQADQVAAGLAVGAQPRHGVTFVRTEVLEVEVCVAA